MSTNDDVAVWDYINERYFATPYGEALSAWYGDRAHGLDVFDTLALDEYAQIARMWSTTPALAGAIADMLRTFADACDDTRSHRLIGDPDERWYV